ncbi:MAG: Crp/Fnr family transcriptional regulator, partial [Dehalococcoidia bacterium]
RRLTIASLLPGAIFGEMALVDQTLGGTCAIALEDSLVSELNWNDLESLLAAYPSVALRIFEVLAYRLEQTRRMLESVVFGDVLGRVAELLLQMADEETQVIEGYCHRELASMVGCLRETFTEALTRFKRTGGVEVGRKWIRITDRDQLQWVSTHNT